MLIMKTSWGSSVLTGCFLVHAFTATSYSRTLTNWGVETWEKEGRTGEATLEETSINVFTTLLWKEEQRLWVMKAVDTAPEVVLHSAVYMNSASWCFPMYKWYVAALGGISNVYSINNISYWMNK